MKTEIQTKAERILTAYFEEDLPVELEHRILEWLRQDANIEEKNKALEKLFFNNIVFTPAPSDKTIRDFDSLSRKLGLTAAEPGGVVLKKDITPIRKLRLRVAAAVIPLILVGGALMIYMIRNFGEKPGTTVTELIAETTHNEITMKDGTYIKLYPGSRMTYPEDYTVNRTVTLNGEADFRVESYFDSPFNVTAGNMAISVIGTEFNVKAYEVDDNATVSLYKGSVKVDAYGQSVTMEPGELFLVDHNEKTVSVSSVPDDKMRQHNNAGLVFTNSGMPDIFKALEKAYGVTIKVIGNISPYDMIEADFTDSVELDEILWILQQLADPFDYTISGKEVTIIGRRP